MGSMNTQGSHWLQRFALLKPVRVPDQQWPRKATPDQSRDIIASVQCILDRQSCFMKEVDRFLRHNDFLDLRKKEMLYKKWLQDVSEPLLQKIKDKMDRQSEQEVRKRKQEQFSQYLNYCRKKASPPVAGLLMRWSYGLDYEGYVSLEYYDPSEYDPFFLKRCTDCWKV